MENLASRLANDEQSAWEELYDATADSLFHYVTVLSGDADATAEILQEAFLRLFRARGRLTHCTDLRAYVFMVTRNEAYRWLRKHARHRGQSPLDDQTLTLAPQRSTDEVELAQHALAALSNDEQELIHLKLDFNFTFAQIARILDWPVGTCASRYRRALAKLRTCIQEQVQ